MKVQFVIWGLEMFQTAAKNLISGLEGLEEKFDNQRAKHAQRHKVNTSKIAEKAAKQQVKVDMKKDKALHSISKQNNAARTQISVLQQKLM